MSEGGGGFGGGGGGFGGGGGGSGDQASALQSALGGLAVTPSIIGAPISTVAPPQPGINVPLQNIPPELALQLGVPVAQNIAARTNLPQPISASASPPPQLNLGQADQAVLESAFKEINDNPALAAAITQQAPADQQQDAVVAEERARLAAQIEEEIKNDQIAAQQHAVRQADQGGGFKKGAMNLLLVADAISSVAHGRRPALLSGGGTAGRNKQAIANAVSQATVGSEFTKVARQQVQAADPNDRKHVIERKAFDFNSMMDIPPSDPAAQLFKQQISRPGSSEHLNGFEHSEVLKHPTAARAAAALHSGDLEEYVNLFDDVVKASEIMEDERNIKDGLVQQVRINDEWARKNVDGYPTGRKATVAEMEAANPHIPLDNNQPGDAARRITSSGFDTMKRDPERHPGSQEVVAASGLQTSNIAQKKREAVVDIEKSLELDAVKRDRDLTGDVAPDVAQRRKAAEIRLELLELKPGEKLSPEKRRFLDEVAKTDFLTQILNRELQRASALAAETPEQRRKRLTEMFASDAEAQDLGATVVDPETEDEKRLDEQGFLIVKTKDGTRGHFDGL